MRLNFSFFVKVYGSSLKLPSSKKTMVLIMEGLEEGERTMEEQEEAGAPLDKAEVDVNGSNSDGSSVWLSERMRLC